MCSLILVVLALVLLVLSETVASKCCCGDFVDSYRYVLFSHGRFKVTNTNHVPKRD
jgi:hypothetical protein